MRTRHIFLSLGTILLLAFSTGCSSGPPRSPVEGLVTVGGNPLAAGRIIFTPVAPNKGPAVSARIAAGRYQADSSAGPIVGKNRVEVEADLNFGFAIDDDEAFSQRGVASIPPSPIPPEFGINSQLSLEVLPGTTNTFDVLIPISPQTASYR